MISKISIGLKRTPVASICYGFHLSKTACSFGIYAILIQVSSIHLSLMLS